MFKVPLIGANTGGIPEVIKPWQTGLLFNRDEPADLADQLCGLLQDEMARELLSQGAYVQLRQRFDSETMARNYLQLYLDASKLSLN